MQAVKCESSDEIYSMHKNIMHCFWQVPKGHKLRVAEFWIFSYVSSELITQTPIFRKIVQDLKKKKNLQCFVFYIECYQVTSNCLDT